MSYSERISSIDILKGLSALLILFANDLYLPGTLPWFGSGLTSDSMTWLSGFAFILFIFMFGMTIPFIISKKINNGLSSVDISRVIFSRSIILIAIGVLMVNTGRVEPELTGFGKYLWSVLMFVAVFLVWNRYPEKEDNFFTISGLRLIGLAIFIFLVFRFRSGTLENNGSLITGSWDLPGILGWGYLISAFTYLALRNSFTGTLVVWLIFLILNVMANSDLTISLDPLRPYLGVLIDGKVPFILLSGHLVSIILKKYSLNEYGKIIIRIISSGVLLITSGLILYQYLSPQSSKDNTGIMLLFTGISMLLFSFIYWLTEVKTKENWFIFFKPAGENFLTAYLAPFILYNLIWLSGIPLLYYKVSGNQVIAVAGSACWAFLMIWLISVLKRLNIRLKI
jgi:heparan-alpha-glucosaminide N-acetyltransferase